MSDDNTCLTSLEHLSTEIFLQIFALFHLQELIATFFGLNNTLIQRFDRLEVQIT